MNNLDYKNYIQVTIFLPGFENTLYIWAHEKK